MLFERIHTGTIKVFVFDSAHSHCRVAESALNVDGMNVGLVENSWLWEALCGVAKCSRCLMRVKCLKECELY